MERAFALRLLVITDESEALQEGQRRTEQGVVIQDKLEKYRKLG
jgi:hypothetical protein